MRPVNVTIQIEETARHRSVHGSILFAKPASREDAVEALNRNGFNHSVVQAGFKREAFEIVPHHGFQRFDFHIADREEAP